MKYLLKTLLLFTILFSFSNCTTDNLQDDAVELETNNSFSIEFFNDSAETIYVGPQSEGSRGGDGDGTGNGMVQIRPGSKTKTKTNGINLGKTTFLIVTPPTSSRATTPITITVVINIEEGYEYFIILNEDNTVSVLTVEL